MNLRIMTSLCLYLTVQCCFADTTIPFQLVGRLMIIEATVEGKTGNFVLDTGAPDIVLNKRYFNAHHDPLTSSSRSINGDQITMNSGLVNLSIGNEKWKNREAFFIELEQLERSKKIKIMGLIGCKIFAKCQIIIDFERSTLVIHKINSGSISANYEKRPADIFLNFKWKSGLPIINGIVGQTNLKFLIDTGSEVNILDLKQLKKLEGHYKQKQELKVVSAGRNAKNAASGFLYNIAFEYYQFAQINAIAMNLTDFDKHASSKSIDGIIGVDFLQHFKVCFDFKEKRIRLWQNGKRELLFAKRDTID